jgi:hypothetical protein
MLNKKDLVQYNTSPIWVSEPGFVEVDENCNGWMAINKGSGVAYVNGVPLNPAPAVGLSGESTGTSGNYGEVFKGSIQVKFAPNANDNLVLFVQKFYIL